MFSYGSRYEILWQVRSRDWRERLMDHPALMAEVNMISPSLSQGRFFKCNIQVMEAMARKEAGESLNKRPSQSQAQVSELNLLWSKLFCELLWLTKNFARLLKTTRARGPNAAPAPLYDFRTRGFNSEQFLSKWNQLDPKKTCLDRASQDGCMYWGRHYSHEF